jgi:hypothetical protein
MRDLSIDILKGILVVLMIFDHGYKLLGERVWLFQSLILLIELATFPGFFFAFGYVYQLVYFNRKEARSIRRIGIGALRTLMAFYVCAVGYFVLWQRLSFAEVIEKIGAVATLREIPPYTEFLPAFTGAALLAMALFPLWGRITAGLILLFCGVSLAAAGLTPYAAIRENILGIFLGTENFSAFPILPYAVFFFLGVYLALGKTMPVVLWLLFALPLGVFLIQVVGLDADPGRFPPSFLWITAGIGLVLLLFHFSKKLAQFPNPVLTVIAWMGKHSLFYLVLSTLALFFVKGLRIEKLSPGIIVLGTGGLLLSIGLLLWGITRARRIGLPGKHPS